MSVSIAQLQFTTPVAANEAATPTTTEAALAVSEAQRTVSFHTANLRVSRAQSPGRSPAVSAKSSIDGGRPATISPNTRCFMNRGVTRTNASRSTWSVELRYWTIDEVRMVACLARSRSSESRTTSARPVISISQLVCSSPVGDSCNKSATSGRAVISRILGSVFIDARYTTGRAAGSSGSQAPGCIIRTRTSSPAWVPTATLVAESRAWRIRWRASSELRSGAVIGVVGLGMEPR